MAKKQKIEIIFQGDNKTGKAVKDVDKSLDKLNESTDKATKGFGAMDVAVGTVVGNIVSGIGSAAIGAFSDLAMSVFDLSREFDDSSSKIQASLNLTQAETEELSGEVEDLFAKGFDVSSATDAIISIRQNMGDLADEELQQVATGVLNISKIFGQDLTKTSNAAGALMKQFGLDSQQSMDFIAKGFQSGLNTSDDFLESISEYSNQFASLGFTADEFFSIMQTGLQGGVLGTDKIADAIKEFGILMQDGSDKTRDGLISLFNAIGAGNPELEKLNEELKQSQANFNIAGKKVEYWEEQLETSKEEADRLSEAIDKTKRALDNLARPKLAGMQEFDDKLFSLGMKAKELQLAMMDMDEKSPEFARTKAALENVNTEMDRLNLQRDLKFEPQFRALADAADYAKEPVVTFNQAMEQIGYHQENLVGLENEFVNMSAQVNISTKEVEYWKNELATSEVNIKALQEAMKGVGGPAQDMLNAISDGSLSVADALPQVLDMLRQIEDPIQQNAIGVALFGTAWEDMTAQAMLSINTTATGMDDMAGSMNNLNEQGKTTGQDQAAAMNQIMLALKPLGDAFNAFVASEIIPLIKEYAPQLAEWIGVNLPIAMESSRVAIEFLKPVIDSVKLAFDAVTAAISFVVETMDLAASVVVNLSAAMQGVISPGTAAKNIFGDLIDPLSDLLDMVVGVSKALVSLGANLFNLKPPAWVTSIGKDTKSKVKSLLGFAKGGDYPSDEPFVVGEEGPELIVPGGVGGTVVPNGQLAGALGGGGIGPVTLNVYISGNADEVVLQKMKQEIHSTLDRLIQGGAF